MENEDQIFTRYCENKLGVLKNILEEFTRFEETINNIFNFLYEILSIINLKADFNHAKMWFIDKIEGFIE